MKRSLLSLGLIFALFTFSCSTQESSVANNPTSIDIYSDGEAITQIAIEVGESLSLTAVTDVEDEEFSFTWSSSDATIASVSSTGLLTGVGQGTTIVSVSVASLPYVTASLFVTVSPVVEQTGVGSGHTADDPIFIGFEGDDPIEVYFIEMQHIYSDSIFIKKGNIEILIDAGYAYDGTFISEFLDEKVTDGRLDMLMVSHSDGDHIEGLNNALANIDNVSVMVDYGGTNSGTVGALRESYQASGTQYHSAYDCVNYIDGAVDRYYFTDEFYVDILDTGNYVTSTTSGAGNAQSVAAIFTYRDFTFFTGGDLTSSAESSLMSREDLPEVTLFKAHHHGSSGSNSSAFLNTINPKGIAISAARANYYNSTPGPASQDNTYNLDGTSGHPHEAAIQRFYETPNISQNLNVYWNAVNGTMKFTSYGTDSFTFSGSPTWKGYYDLTLTDGTPVWNDELNDWENKVTGEENLKFHETKMFEFRGYQDLLPDWVNS